jgi:hypothetical protein
MIPARSWATGNAAMLAHSPAAMIENIDSKQLSRPDGLTLTMLARVILPKPDHSRWEEGSPLWRFLRVRRRSSANFAMIAFLLSK